MAIASNTKLKMTSIPTRSSLQAIVLRCAIFTPLLSGQKLLYIRILGPAQNLVRPFENNFPIPQQQKARVRDAERVSFILECHLARSIRRVHRGESERIAHAVSHE